MERVSRPLLRWGERSPAERVGDHAFNTLNIPNAERKITMLQVGIFNGYFPYPLEEQAKKIKELAQMAFDHGSVFLLETYVKTYLGLRNSWTGS